MNGLPFLSLVTAKRPENITPSMDSGYDCKERLRYAERMHSEPKGERRKERERERVIKFVALSVAKADIGSSGTTAVETCSYLKCLPRGCINHAPDVNFHHIPRCILS
jgi:hypothetical protein